MSAPLSPQVRTLFGPDFLEMWAVGGGAAYHLHLPSLYGRLQPKKCGFKVNQVRGEQRLRLWEDTNAQGVLRCWGLDSIHAPVHPCPPPPPPHPPTPPPPFPSTQKAKKVYLLLKKESDAEWRFLKG